jgi:hypothetical protein
MGEIWNIIKSESVEKRRRNRENGPKLLTERGFDFKSRNDGAHLIVEVEAVRVDYWPGTGKWISKTGIQGRGVFRLLRFLDSVKAWARKSDGA